MAEQSGGRRVVGAACRPECCRAGEPLPGVVARPNLSLVIPYRKGKAKTTDEPLHTVATRDSAALIAAPTIDIDDCRFRMLNLVIWRYGGPDAAVLIAGPGDDLAAESCGLGRMHLQVCPQRRRRRPIPTPNTTHVKARYSATPAPPSLEAARPPDRPSPARLVPPNRRQPTLHYRNLVLANRSRHRTLRPGSPCAVL